LQFHVANLHFEAAQLNRLILENESLLSFVRDVFFFVAMMH